jgi:hypothetical protein
LVCNISNTREAALLLTARKNQSVKGYKVAARNFDGNAAMSRQSRKFIAAPLDAPPIKAYQQVTWIVQKNLTRQYRGNLKPSKIIQITAFLRVRFFLF